MTQKKPSRGLTRRNFIALGGGLTAVAAGVNLLPGIVSAGNVSHPLQSVAGAPPPVNFHLAATDGWAAMPVASPALPPYYPDPYGPGQRNLYIFGFRDVTNLTPAQTQAQKNKTQISAPLLYVDQEADVRITLSNLGLTVRPDLVDSHTIHWHGFRNAIPLFDGVPEMSIAVPIGRDFTYFYHPHEPGTYMYHCHFEDVEHVQMGMTGVIFVKPAQNQTPLHPGEKYVYNDGNGSTRYDREYVIFLSEVWAAAHWADAHIQLIDWSEYQADFYLMNGRAYPDTIAPNQDPMNPTDPRLQYNPISSLISANSGEKVLLRFVNLGYLQHSMTLGGIPMRVVGKDATLLRGRDGTDTSYLTNTIYFGPGESYDAIFTAPAVTSQSTYLLYNRKYSYLNNAGAGGYGGQMTEARIYPAGTLPPQTVPNT